MLKSGTIIVDRYEIIGQIGAGGMADVYKARDNKLNRYVAVKVMKSEFREDSTFIKKFTREAQAAAGLANPNIVNVFDVGEDNGVYFIVMELVEGITLKEYINKKGKLSIREATSIAIQVCMGLEAAHAQNIVHRDVKPQNIIISTDGKVKVTDFGIARAASSNTISSNAMGSVHYSSPEQVRGGYADTKSDIYSLGITLYEMITGRVPFDGDTTVSIAIKHLQDEMDAPSKYTPEIPRSLEQIIYKCTQKSPDRRYASMAGVINDLKHSLIDPNGDFVRLTPLSDHAQTVMISSAEMAAIKAAGSRAAKQEEPVTSSEYNTYNSTAAARKSRDEVEEEYEEKRRRSRRYEEDEDEEEEGEISSKLEKAMTIGGFIVGALIICILVYFIASAAGIFKFGPSSKKDDVSPTPSVEENQDGEIKVPTITGLTPESAQELANQFGLGVTKGGEEASESVPAGQIARQEPEAGAMVDKNTTIKYYISTGKTKAVIPNVVNRTLSEAQQLLNEENITNITVTKENSETVAVGNVISVTPGEGSQINPTDAVTLVVSTGSATKMVTVPSVGGYSKAEATSMMENKGLIVKYDTGTSENVAIGEVMAQSIKGGTEVAQGTEITLTINTEAAATPTPATPSTTPTTPSEGGNQGSSWTCNQSVAAPSNYENGNVKLVLEQSVDGSAVTTTIYEGDPLTFPYALKLTGASGVSSGKVYMYEMVNGAYKLRCNWPVTFTQG